MRQAAATTGLVGLGLALRLWGLSQGYPAFYGHVDEVGVAASIWNFLRNATLEPTEFTYPALYSYLVAAAIWLSGALGLHPGLPPGGTLLERLAFLSWLDPGWSALLGRGVSAMAGAAGIAVILRTGVAIGGRPVGLLAGLFAAVAVVPVRYAHHALPDVAAALFAALVMWFSWRLAQTGSWRHALLAGAATGLVLATKYNGALCALAVVAGHAEGCVGAGSWRRPWRLLLGVRLWVAGALAVATAALASPYLVLAWQRYLSVAGYQVSSLDFAMGRTMPWWWIPRGLVVEELVVGGLMLAGLSIAVARRDTFDRLALAVLLPAGLYIGSWTRESLHYLLPYYPWLCILAARALATVLASVPQAQSLSASRGRVVVAAGLLAAVPSLWRTAQQDAALTQPDVRALAANWIERHVPDGSVLGVTWLPYAPRLDLRDARQGILAHYAERPDWQARLRQAWAGRPAYHLVNLEAWLRRPVVPAALRDQVDLNDPETRRVFSRGWRSADRLIADGVSYIVLPDAVYARYQDSTQVASTVAADFRRRLNRAYFTGLITDPRVAALQTIPAAGQTARGSPITIYRIRRPAGS